MSEEIIENVKQMIQSGKSHRETARVLKISLASIHIILTGKKYKYDQKKYNGILVRGLSKEQMKNIYAISKNTDKSQNRVLLSYIRAGINAEHAQNKIYED